MLTWEFKHANEALYSGTYVTWISQGNKEDCFRVGSESKCFCGHFFKDHFNEVGKKLKNNCKSCKCIAFRFIP